MTILIDFLVATLFSFLGSIPPGTINLTVFQLGLQRKKEIALRLGLAAALVEYPYTWIAIKLESLITSSPLVIKNFQLLGGIVMIVFGVLNLWAVRRPNVVTKRFENSGFRRGLVMGLLNPMAMPFWIGVTAFLESLGWVDLSTGPRIQAYLVGVVLGTIILLILLTFLAGRLMNYFDERSRIKLVPGIVLIVLGCYALLRYLI